VTQSQTGVQEKSNSTPVVVDADNFRLLVDSIPDYAIFMIDTDGIIRTWNHGARRLEGFEETEVVGTHFSRFFTEEDKAAGKPGAELDVANAEGRYEGEGWRVRKDGSRFWAGVTVTPIIDSHGVHRGYGKVTRDLSERRRFEQRHRLMVESVKDYGIFMLDPDGNVRSWNLGAELIKGYKAEEILGRHFSTFYTEKDIRDEHPADELRQAIASGRFEEEGWRVRKDGSRFWANVVITPLYDDNKTLVGFSKVTRDLTERKYSEEQLKKAYEELESFSYSVSHDLRAPLRSMDGFSDILLTTASEKLDEKSKGYLTRIRESSQRMARLIDDLLNLSRLSREPLNLKTVQLSDLAQKHVAELRKTQPARNVEVVIQPGLKAQADPSLIQVVIENLISNAWKYSSKVEHAKIEFGSIVNSSGGTEFYVRDNGAGFDMGYKDKLFGAFQRLHGVNDFPGTGIGLATVKRIVHRHGGDVWVEGEVGKGATFYFTLKN
jgi:PAS domain S-box-containing protein